MMLVSKQLDFLEDLGDEDLTVIEDGGEVTIYTGTKSMAFDPIDLIAYLLNAEIGEK